MYLNIESKSRVGKIIKEKLPVTKNVGIVTPKHLREYIKSLELTFSPCFIEIPKDCSSDVLACTY